MSDVGLGFVSMKPATQGNAFETVWITSGTTIHGIRAMGIQGGLSADAVWNLLSPIVHTVPAGSPSLLLSAFADAATGDVDVLTAWGVVGPGIDPGSVALTAEAVATHTWTTGQEGLEKQLVIALDAATAPVAGERWMIRLTFQLASTILVPSAWLPEIRYS